MPTVQSELQAKGVTFENAFVVNPLCCPSRASILTGKWSHTTGVYRNGDLPRFDARRTIAVSLQRAGYRTGFLGKYLNGYAATWVPPGWERWFAFVPSHAHTFLDWRANVDGKIVQYGTAEQDYSTDVLAAEADSFIRLGDERPFFLAVFPYAPHGPAVPAARHAGTVAVEPWRPEHYDEDTADKPGWYRGVTFDPVFTDAFRQLQLESLRAVDDMVGRVLTALTETGRLENTLILFTSDNGFMWGEHRAFGKLHPYEESIRVPLVARYDALGGGGRAEARFALNTDLAATISDYTGVTHSAEGKSLRPLLEGTEAAWRTRFLIESGGYPGYPMPTYCAVRTADRMYAMYRDGSQELYDLAADPYQLANIRSREARYDMRRTLGRLCRPKPPGFSWPSICTRFGDRRSNVIVGRPWFEVVCARHGKDRIFVRDGRRDVVFCGRDRDRVLADPVDEIRPDCEQVRRG